MGHALRTGFFEKPPAFDYTGLMGELTLFIDLDDTLYPADSGVWQDIRNRIDLYMRDVLGIPAAEVNALRQDLFARYGTTLRGLEASMQVDTADYLRFVHDVPLSRYLTPNPELRQILSGYPAGNSSSPMATACMRCGCWRFSNFRTSSTASLTSPCFLHIANRCRKPST